MKKVKRIEWTVTGESMQAAVVRIPAGDAVVGEAGAMLFASDGIRLDTGLSTRSDEPSLVASLAEAIKRRIAGDTFFVTRFTNESSAPAEVAFASPVPGTILVLELDEHPQGIILQKDAFLCGSQDVEISVAFQRRVLAGLFGGEGFVLQRIGSKAAGAVVLASAGGSLLERSLGEGQSLRIDAGCVVAYEPTVDFDVRLAGNASTVLFGGHGAFLATLKGPGRVWVQTMPFPRLAARIWDAAPQRAELPAEQEEAADAAVKAGVRPEARS